MNTSARLSDQEKKHPVSSYFIRDWNDLRLSTPYFGSQMLTDTLGIENKTGAISVNEAREISSILSLQPYESDYKIMVIWQPEKMSTDAANKLLKLLEEPPAGTLFLLVTQNMEKMLPTVLSRCQIIRLDAQDAMNIATLSSGSMGRAMAEVEQMGEESQRAAITRSLMEAALSKSLSEVLDIADSLASMGKDKQRQWCVQAESFVRKLYMSACGLQSIAFAGEQEKEYIATLVPRIKESFYGKAAAALDAAIRLIEGNVSAKLVFADLGNRFYLYI